MDKKQPLKLLCRWLKRLRCLYDRKTKTLPEGERLRLTRGLSGGEDSNLINNSRLLFHENGFAEPDSLERSLLQFGITYNYDYHIV